MDSCLWTTLNVKQNPLKTKHAENIETLITRTGVYTYTFPQGIIIIKFDNNQKGVSAPYPYIPHSLVHTPHGP